MRQGRGGSHAGYLDEHLPLWGHVEDCVERASAWSHPREEEARYLSTVSQ